MTISRRPAVLLATAVLLSGAAFGTWRRRPTPTPAPAVDDAVVREQDISFYLARIARDPQGALDRAQLASLYLQRARDAGNPEDLVRAEGLARQSLGIRERRNAFAMQVLAASLLAQHRYREALEYTRELVADDPDRTSTRALLAEIQMELGLYMEAESSFAILRGRAGELSVAPRLARWAELHGDLDEAHRILVQAREVAMRVAGLSREQKAWFHLRVGDLALRYGHLGEAQDALRAGLAAAPDDYRLLAAMARLHAVRQQWQLAIEYGERAVALVPDPATLGLVGDAYAAAGDTAEAEDYVHAMEVAVLHQPGPFHRAWSLFLLDHNRRLPEVLANVEAEAKDRKDIYGYDLLGWALYKNGRPLEARAAARAALRLGTKDPQILLHAGIIELVVMNSPT